MYVQYDTYCGKRGWLDLRGAEICMGVGGLGGAGKNDRPRCIVLRRGERRKIIELRRGARAGSGREDCVREFCTVTFLPPLRGLDQCPKATHGLRRGRHSFAIRRRGHGARQCASLFRRSFAGAGFMDETVHILLADALAVGSGAAVGIDIVLPWQGTPDGLVGGERGVASGRR
jgi:hypothetical protein